jgi:hypothetical protein
MPRTNQRKRSTVFLLVLSSLLVMPMAISAQSAIPTLTPAQQDIAKAYSIDPALKYPGYSVIQGIDKILQAAAEQAKADSKVAWDSGYKQGVLDWKPKYDGSVAEVKYWKDLLLAEKIEHGKTVKAYNALVDQQLYILAAGGLLAVTGLVVGHFVWH